MKNLINYFKTGMSLIPAYLIIFYLLFITTDIITTYMASPDLKYEFNRVVRYFNLNFTGIIILAIINATWIIICLFTGRGYVESYSDEQNEEGKSLLYKLIHNWRLLLAFIVITIFYAHLFNSFYVTINNYLSHIYLNRPDSTLKETADKYILFTNYFEPFYVRLTQMVTTILGAIFTLYYFRLIESRKRKYSAEYSITSD
jgi:NADH:ubiquinone oxidoreductase subunit 6 (subunit J)